MAHVQQALVDLLLNGFGEIEQAQQVRDGSARASYRIRNLLMRKVKILDQAQKCLRFLEWIQVFALDILDQPNRRGRFGIEFPDDRRDFLQTGKLGRTPASFTRHQLEVIGFGTHDDGLHNTLLANRIGEFPQGLLLEHLARLVLAALNTINIELDQSAGFILNSCVGDVIEVTD